LEGVTHDIVVGFTNNKRLTDLMHCVFGGYT
jgi:hypothetical protein